MDKYYRDYFILGNEENYSKEEVFYFNEIKNVIVNYFEKENINFDYEERVVFTNLRDYPYFASRYYNKNLDKEYINLKVKSFSYWSQVIYQLSHEITHVFIYCQKKDREGAPWIEETICEAVSLYFLDYFASIWSETGLYRINNNYSKCLNDYLTDILQEEGNSRLSNCSSMKELEDINRTSEVNREDRKQEMKTLFYLIKQSDLKSLVVYRLYLRDKSFLLDTDKYLADYNSRAINYICLLQKRIITE